MFKKILGTAGSRIIIAAMSLLITLLNAKYLGAEGVGTIGLIVLGITIILLLNNFIGGPILVYFLPREDNFKLLTVSYLWTIIVISVFGIIVQFVHFVPVAYSTHILILSLIYSFFSINLYFLLGSQRIKEHNIITSIQQFIQLSGLIVYFIILKEASVNSFVKILYFSFVFTFISTSFLVFRSVKRTDFQDLRNIFIKVLKLGSFGQVAYVVQLLNYRLSYYIIDFYIGRVGLGVFHFGNQLAEGSWVVGKSVSIVQYSGISNSNDQEYAKRLTLRLLKLTLIATMAILLVFLMLPQSVFAFFGKSFSDTRLIIGCLAVGIIANAASMMFSHYFAGLGKPHYNTIGSSVGLIFTVSFGFWLIPSYGIVGAAITASFSYLASVVYQFIEFCKATKPGIKDFLITIDDYQMLKAELKKFLTRNSVQATVLDENLPQ